MMNEQSLKDKLKSIAKEKKSRFNFCWKQIVMERFLCRLSRSSAKDHLVFKGGFLLSYMLDIKRETVDLDFLLWKFKAGEESIQKLIHEILQVECGDGFSFFLNNVSLLSHPQMPYKGYQVSLQVHFGNMKDKLHIDIGIGDFVRPQSRQLNTIHYKGKPLFDDPFLLWTYPTESILSEKLEAILSRGAANSRIKDYHDVYLILRMNSIHDPNRLKDSIQKTFKKRNTILGKIRFENTEIEKLQRLWKSHLLSLGKNAAELELPNEIQSVIDSINHLIEKNFQAEE